MGGWRGQIKEIPNVPFTLMRSVVNTPVSGACPGEFLHLFLFNALLLPGCELELSDEALSKYN